MPIVEIAQHWVDELVELQPHPATVTIDEAVDTALQQYMFRKKIGIATNAMSSAQ